MYLHSKKVRDSEKCITQVSDYYRSKQITLIPRDQSEGESDPVLKPTELIRALSEFQVEMTKVCKQKDSVFSMYSGVLNLPLNPDDFPDKQKMVYLISSILADHGFWFEEVRPIAKGQIDAFDRATAKNPEGVTAHLAMRGESETISTAMQMFYNYCNLVYDPSAPVPAIIENLEKKASPHEKDWFRRCICEANDHKGSMKRLRFLWYEKISKNNGKPMMETFNDCLKKVESETGEVFTDKNEMPITLKRAQDKLFEILLVLYNEQMEAAAQILSEKIISEDAKALYKLNEKRQNVILAQWKNSRWLDIRKADWTDTFKTIIKDLKKVKDTPVKEKRKVGKYLSDGEKRSCSNVDSKQIDIKIMDFNEGMKRITKSKKEGTVKALKEVFMKYLKADDGKDISESIEQVFLFSCNPQFHVSDEDSDRKPTLAPIITYFMFVNYSKQIRKNSLYKISVDQLFEKKELEIKNREHRWKREVSLFEELCNVYINYYKKRKPISTGKELMNDYVCDWMIAFEAFTGCTTYQYSIYNHDSTSLFTKHPFYDSIRCCLEANSKIAAHIFCPEYRKGVKDMLPSLLDVAKSAIQELRDILKKQMESADLVEESVVYSYQKLFLVANNHKKIRDSLFAALKTIAWGIGEEDSSKSANIKNKCKDFSKKHQLSEKFPKELSNETEQILILLEFSIRTILMEQCAGRLICYINACLDYLSAEAGLDHNENPG